MEVKSVRNMYSIIAVTNKHTAKLLNVGSLYILTYDVRKLKHKIPHSIVVFDWYWGWLVTLRVFSSLLHKLLSWQTCIHRINSVIFFFSVQVCKYSRVSFCDGSFYDDSLLWPLSSQTQHSRLVVHHCRNSSVLSLLSALPALFQCACVSSFSISVQFF